MIRGDDDDKTRVAYRGEERVERVVRHVIVGHDTIWLDAVFEAVQFPAGISNLAASLTNVDRDYFAHVIERVLRLRVVWWKIFLRKKIRDAKRDVKLIQVTSWFWVRLRFAKLCRFEMVNASITTVDRFKDKLDAHLYIQLLEFNCKSEVCIDDYFMNVWANNNIWSVYCQGMLSVVAGKDSVAGKDKGIAKEIPICWQWKR